MNILSFLTQLDSNLNNSLNAFQNLGKNTNNVKNTNCINKISDLNSLYDLIQSNNKKLYKYLEYIKELEIAYFANQEIEKEQFLFSFNIDSDLYDKNFKERFKNDIKTNINIHKLKSKYVDSKDLIDTKPVLEKRTISNLESIDITPNNLNITVVKDLKDIPPMFYWYDGDSTYKKGVYACMAPGFYSRVPFPNTISALSKDYKINSIPCKYETKESCTIYKKKISEIWKSDIRECTYVHRKEKFNKIGSFYRCNVERFGDYENLNTDMNLVNVCDIKRILMYSLSDSLLSVLWYQNKFKDGRLILNNIETY